MCTMINISRKPTNNDALIRIYKSECHLNAKAATLLHLNDERRAVRFSYDYDSHRDGNKSTFICGCENEATRSYICRKHGRSFRLSSTDLCTILADRLQGYGVYRICPEVNATFEGRIYYEIFFKKY